ncbi:uncharacterized protein [Misgurnus anguillicaudatus]|uniref:uncharacterized protein n=1 Tax=Misgurnus anguillicaudatus TaxID=75329 RepID=UPI003CCF5214
MQLHHKHQRRLPEWIATYTAFRRAFAEVKRVRILEKLAALRADGPVVAMASTLDLQREEEQAGEEAIDAPAEEDDKEQPCGSEACESVADFKGPTEKLLQALESPTEEVGPSTAKRSTTLREKTPRPSSTPPQESEQGSDPVKEESATSLYPEHNVVPNQLLVEYRLQQQGPEPSRKLKENVAGNLYWIRSFIGHMAAGNGRLSTLEFLDDPGRIRNSPADGRAARGCVR